ncbi:malto-oligosyltrehalose synthase [Opitutus sp. ER46]|uniref:malto-oligosyltrehalose synthase n=1 Tax=Opitutus sp. ER46 TaxID=2161864 RepID=UPI000D32571F|nr:malto-oligosyltrehalose synthase [Opitutus sp. ER46]PTX94393.1 malto-oligosyltrehalose synthase [Opitutus sp. ER46]
MPFTDAEGVPLSTYRLQLRKDFPFDAARGLLPYFDDLGITHCYLSPIFMSAPGSTHGYDVNDYHRIDAELGGRQAFDAFAKAARARRMGLVLDFVPNHMGIHGSSNRWWQDVLECGRSSPHADFFDVDWNDPFQPGRTQVLVPVLDDQYGVVLEAGRLAIGYEDGAFSVRYADLRFPVSPATYAMLLAGASEQPECTESARDRLRAIAEAFRSLPLSRGADEPIGRRPRNELKAQLAAAAEADPGVGQAIAAHLAVVNGPEGGPHDRDRLDELLAQQHYRLAHWKTGAHEVNYRRFFAIDTLIGLRMENSEVFRETHRILGGFIRDGIVAGVRIDHIDGLRNPLEYLERLQGLALKERETATRPVYVVVEKILEPGEEIDRSWPAHGTTGYEFIRQLSGLFVARAAGAKLDALYRDFTGEQDSFRDVVYQNKRLVLDEMFANAVVQLSQRLSNLVASDRRWRDLTRFELSVAVREIMAALGVYRIYRRMNAECRPEDAREIEHACKEAIRRNPRQDPQPFQFVRDVLVGRYPPPSATQEYRESLWWWVLTWQQYTGAIMAKAVEDTVFYAYNRFIALNEVGGDPDAFGGTVAAFHADAARRRETMPHTLLTTSTHDTKFGEDVRARLYVLSELADEWRDWVYEWHAMNVRHKTSVGGCLAPDANEEYRIYQTLLGCWPMPPFTPDEAFRSRLKEHLRKATNEAKRNTQWLHPNERWLTACDHFIDGLLDRATGGDFLDSFAPRALLLAHLGLVNSLAQLVLKLTTPGVPDFYQGCETWNLTLVDPDNRQLIAWGPRTQAAAMAARRPWRELLRDWREGGIKLRLTRDLLRFRRAHAALFQEGSYEAVEPQGRFAENLVCFVRRCGGQTLLVAVPRFSSRLGCPPLGLVWEDTCVTIPDAGFRPPAAAGCAPTPAWRDVLTGAEFASGGPLPFAELFRELPLAVLHLGAPH